MANGPFTKDIVGHTLMTDPLRNFRFVVEFLQQSGDAASSTFNPAIGFTNVNGLNVTTESIPYREGGYNTTVHQIPGQTVFGDVTFVRGVTLGSDQNHKWMRRLFSATADRALGGAGTNFRYNIDISILSHPNAAGSAGAGSLTPADSATDQHVAMKFRLYNAWIKNLSYGDLSAGDNRVFVEQMTVVHEGLDIKWAADYATKPDTLNF